MYVITKEIKKKRNKDPGGSRTARRVPPVDPHVLPAGPLPLTTNASTSLPAALRDGRTSGRARTLPFMAALGSALFFCESKRASLMAITHQSAYWKKRAALRAKNANRCSSTLR
jgi:hypothetical protein